MGATGGPPIPSQFLGKYRAFRVMLNFACEWRLIIDTLDAVDRVASYYEALFS